MIIFVCGRYKKYKYTAWDIMCTNKNKTSEKFVFSPKCLTGNQINDIMLVKIIPWQLQRRGFLMLLFNHFILFSMSFYFIFLLSKFFPALPLTEKHGHFILLLFSASNINLLGWILMPVCYFCLLLHDAREYFSAYARDAEHSHSYQDVDSSLEPDCTYLKCHLWLPA